MAPLIRVDSTEFQHSWLDPQGIVVGHPHLVRWNAHCILGNVVRNIVSEFVARPPTKATTFPGALASSLPTPSIVGSQSYQYGSTPATSGINSVPAMSYYAAPRSNDQPAEEKSQPPPPDNSHIQNRISLPPVPSTFDEIKEYSIEKIKEYCEDEHAFQECLESLGIYQGVSSLRDDLESSVLELAGKGMVCL
jgi:hypothetical protein